MEQKPRQKCHRKGGANAIATVLKFEGESNAGAKRQREGSRNRSQTR